MREKKGIASEKLAVPRPEATRKSASNLRFLPGIPENLRVFRMRIAAPLRGSQ